jgi:hypothetical protein
VYSGHGSDRPIAHKTEEKHMTGEKYIDVDGIKSRYFEKGSGHLVVLFHDGRFGSRDAADCAEYWSLNFDGLCSKLG